MYFDVNFLIIIIFSTGGFFYILFLYTDNSYVELNLYQQIQNALSGLEDDICIYSMKYQNYNFDVDDD